MNNLQHLMLKCFIAPLNSMYFDSFPARQFGLLKGFIELTVYLRKKIYLTLGQEKKPYSRGKEIFKKQSVSQHNSFLHFLNILLPKSPA